MVYRIYVEKKDGFDTEAKVLLGDINKLLEINSLENLRVVNRYDAENIDGELFAYAVKTVFSEPQVDNATENPDFSGARCVFAVEYLPGQFDQRADSAAQCISLISQKDRPLVRSAKVYVLLRRRFGCRNRRHKEVRHKPRRSARSFARKIRHSRGGLRDPHGSGNP